MQQHGHGIPPSRAVRINTEGVRDTGMPCPNCNSRRSIVLDSRLTHNLGRRRQRACWECDHRWSTIEISTELFEAMRRAGAVMETPTMKRMKNWYDADPINRLAAAIYKAIHPYEISPPDRAPIGEVETASWERYRRAAQAALASFDAK